MSCKKEKCHGRRERKKYLFISSLWVVRGVLGVVRRKFFGAKRGERRGGGSSSTSLVWVLDFASGAIEY